MATKLNVNLVSSYDLSADTTDDVGTNNLTNTGVAFTGTDLFAANAVFDGVADQAQIADASQTGMDAGTGSFSCECWARPAATGATYFLIGKRGGGGANDIGWQIDFNGTAGKIRLYMSDGTDSAVAATTDNYAANTNYHIVVVADHGAAQLASIYVNGALAGTAVDITAVGNVSNSDPFVLGYFSALSANFFNGQAARGRLWIGRALTASEVTTLYNGGSGLTYAQLAQYPLDPSTGDPRKNAKRLLLHLKNA